jgi:hypothetical protein
MLSVLWTRVLGESVAVTTYVLGTNGGDKKRHREVSLNLRYVSKISAVVYM